MQQIIKKFEEFMGKYGRLYSQFYVGIASDPEDRLINGHGVSRNIPSIYWNIPINTNAVREIEKYFLDRGCKGGPGGGDNNTNYIYTYLITPQTRQ